MQQKKEEPWQLPVLPSYPLGDVAEGIKRRLRICGCVAHTLELEAADLAHLPRQTWQAPFSCEEGWTVPALTWEGWHLRSLLDLAQPLPAARAVAVCAGSYSVWLTLEEAGQALLCDRLNGAPLAREHGAPWRLLVPGGKCYTSVKWVDTLLVGETAGISSGEEIARQRLETR
ncbi:molybdopterin-dependent oxidoreductase [Thermogemmatispora carboxidivorans]|uniref:molybdopterin-dependent oxidoreductase n=1 Tax=Thermogemmatispora carboxidivorans TaxID=1382306 RepID=UPI00069AA322|nr:molybdopterin-dependent oxidoreductase [Thermogemmatispora carboxidivorans]